MEIEKTYNLKSGRILQIIEDKDPQSPDDWGNNDIFLVYEHRQFTVVREGFEPRNIHEYYMDPTDGNSYSDYFIFPVKAYIHSGVALSIRKDVYPFNDKWDVSTTGYVLVAKKEIDFEANRKSKPEWANLSDEDLAYHFAESLIVTWNTFLSGDVWGFRVVQKVKYYKVSEKQISDATFVTKDTHRVVLWKDEIVKEENEEIEEEEVDSCWGFYGSNPLTNGMLDHINDEILIEEVSK